MNSKVESLHKSLIEQIEQRSSISKMLSQINQMSGISKTLSEFNRFNINESIAEQVKQMSSISKTLSQFDRFNINESIADHVRQMNSVSETLSKINPFNIDESLIQQVRQMNSISKTLSQFDRFNINESIAEQVKQMSSISKTLSQFDRFNINESIADHVRQMNSVSETLSRVNQFNTFKSLIDEIYQATSKFYDLEAFNTISNLRNSPLNRHYDFTNTEFTKNKEYYDIHDLDNEINNEIAEIKDFEYLPEITQNKIIFYLKCRFYYIFDKILVPIVIGLILTHYSNSDIEKLLTHTIQQMTEVAEVKKFARDASAQYDSKLLSNFRAVTGRNVNLRTRPSINSEVIMQLNVGNIVKILDKSDRSWLLVEFSDNGFIAQGWIARRYTTHFK